ncbi:LPS export ABC transporter periplasmic protein LptC [Ideonella paludis]|uniref:LPS export ABC transporter periplasmic protein LptC n=1 Tax=Ideonella paludis TaxID=1233411 RepID=A0ABS5DSV1_9BURK|nr:LPS export ABC transporter periplasmic protein LptC [Ideonella paludis]MBQ0934185.1 LPS export ABC transporter periplasmic protein LptC [Ideonella paludis]
MNHPLHLPDLPEVPASLSEPLAPVVAGPGQRRRVVHWPTRLKGLLATYLPLLMMALLALGTWWLVKNAPKPVGPAAEKAVRHEPDYTMATFSIERFDAQGRPIARLMGEQLRHYPDTDEIEIDIVQLIATGEDGRVTHATARRAVALGDGTQVRLEGGAKVVSTGAEGDVVQIEGDRLIAYLKERRMVADKPVRVRQGQSEFQADALDFDQTQGQLLLQGRVQARLQPNVAPAFLKP